MAKITQYSRISHHTLYGSASATFSIPTSEDFTDGTWTARDLSLSEIGVNEDAGRAYIRIGSEVKEFEFAGGTFGAESLATTLAVGNTSGPNHIYMNDGYGIWNNNSTAFIRFNDTPGQEIYHNVNNGTGKTASSTDVYHTSTSWYANTIEGDYSSYIYVDKDLIEINSEIDSLTSSNFQIRPTSIYMENSDNTGFNNSQIGLSYSGIFMAVSDSSYGTTNSFYMGQDVMSLRHDNDNDAWGSEFSFDGTSPQSQLSTYYNDGSAIGRVRTSPGIVDIYSGKGTPTDYVSTTQTNSTFRVLHVESNVEKNEIVLGEDIDNNFRVGINQTNFSFGTTSTTGFASASVVVLDLPTTGNHAWVKVQVKAINGTYSKAYVADMFGGFRNDGSPNLIGTGYSVIEYTDFTGGVRADFDISSTRIRVRGYGETGSTIAWSANLTWG
jgi:hypothetical protein